MTLPVLANDEDASGDPLTVTGFTNGAHGTVTRSGTDRLVYTPATGFTGSDTFTYAIEDAAHGTSSTTVTITVQNAAPIAVPDSFTVRPGVANSLPVAANDTDPNTGQVLRVHSVTGGTKGTVVVDPDGTVVYTPRPDATGTDTFDYVVTDDAGGTDTGTVVVTIDQAPVAVADTADTGSGTAVVIDVLRNDTDPEAGALSVVRVSRPSHGTATVNPDNSVRYVPSPGFLGTDTFTYDVRDEAGSIATATVTVTVANAAPVAHPDVAAVAAGQRADIEVLANDTDVNPGQKLKVLSVGNPANGTVTRLADGRLRYKPAAGFVGKDTFTYVADDGDGGTATGTVTVTVTDGAPVALPDSGTTPYLHPITLKVLGNDLEPQGGPLTVTAVTQPSSGRVTITGTSVRYEPVEGFSGIVTFSYTVTDGDGLIATATVTVSVGTPPEVPDKNATAKPGAPVAIKLPTVDQGERPVRVISVGRPSHGTARLDANGQVVYTPAKGFVGTDSFRYFAEDADGNTAWATIKVTVAGPASAPKANDDAYTVEAGGTMVLAPLFNDTDPDNDKLTVKKIGKPRHGAAVLNRDGTVTYAPAKGYTGGTDTFGYTITDGHGGTDTATVTITVTEVAEVTPTAGIQLPKTGADIMSVAGAGILALLLGAMLYGFGLRGTPVPALAGTRRHRPGRHRPGRHTATYKRH